MAGGLRDQLSSGAHNHTKRFAGISDGFPGSKMQGFGPALPVDNRWDAVIIIRTSALQA
jgi:hypothetical protein